jgi:mannose-6-phosphate isomerase-like protein (cupin superfamily)
MRTKRPDISAYVTKDGSEIRELMHPNAHGAGRISLAEAIVKPGNSTLRHTHRVSEEIYHVTRGRGRMRLGLEEFDIEAGDTIRIAPGTEHGLVNTGGGDLAVLCCCCPPYTHEDTELT